jgi:hypothetical protein
VWFGTISQPANPTHPQFTYRMALAEDATGAVSGTSSIAVIGQPMYDAVRSLTGRVASGV